MRLFPEKTLLKICGLMQAEDVSMCCRLGVDICGFVTEYPIPVPWNLTRNQCTDLLQNIVSPTKSCIVTGGEKKRVTELVLALQPDYVQLHFNEKVEDVEYIVQALSPYNIKVIKTIPASCEERYQQFGISDPKCCAQKLCDIGVSVILVDSRGPSNAAGGGGTADFPLFHRVRAAASCPVMLGGGITPDNCREMIAKTQPDIVDVMTGVETVPGKKNEELVSKLIKCIS